MNFLPQLRLRKDRGGRGASQTTTTPPQSSSNSFSTAGNRVRAKEVDHAVSTHSRVVSSILVWLVIFFKLFLVAGIIGLVIFLKYPKTTSSSDSITVEIKKGEGVRQIAARLSEKNIIDNQYSFIFYVFWHKKALQEGIYLFQPHQKVAAVYQKLSTGKVSQQKITIIEGWRTEQIAQYLRDKKIIEYDDFVRAARNFEGKLFPDTYFITLKPTVDSLISQMVDNFNQRTSQLNPSRDQLILASIIEREAKRDEDRAIISSVFYNRLAKGMKLEADPTVQYAIDNERLEKVSADEIASFEFWQKLSSGVVKTVVSPFNTYRAAGLPPAPISNPGLKSVQAAVNPASSDYLYFLTDKDGVAHFARTKAEHDVNIGKYLL